MNQGVQPGRCCRLLLISHLCHPGRAKIVVLKWGVLQFEAVKILKNSSLSVGFLSLLRSFKVRIADINSITRPTEMNLCRPMPTVDHHR
jgi:hypothetical protein